MITIEKLKEFGADTDEGIGRCVGSEQLYLQLMPMVINEPNFEALSKAVEEGDLTKAFEAAHALKGVLGNLSLTPLYEMASEITELLRHQSEADYAQLVSALLEKKAEFESLFE
ncbi:MAG: Hpt domain-containing protein [Erysipelotrichaceae bacterium]|nr:Hpt domain-containing protein [Erysipelotrichaceae bacterium]